MKKHNVIMLAASLLVATMAFAQTDVDSQNVVGFYKIDITNGLNLLSAPMHKAAAYRGVITSHDATTITDTNASWVTGEWNMLVDTTGTVGGTYQEVGLSTFYIEITAPTSSAFAGRHYYITANADSDTLTVAGGDFVSPNLQGASYKIVAANRIQDVFGPEDAPVLKSGAFSDADKIYIYDTDAAQWKDTVYHFTNDTWSVWRDASGIANDRVIDRDAGFFVESAGTTNITITGEVSGNEQKIVFGQGLNLVGGMAVVNKELWETTLEVGMTKGAFSDADKIYRWDPVNGQWLDAVYFFTNDTWYVWRDAGGVATNELLDASTGYFLEVNNPAGFTWTRPSPIAE